MSVALICCVSFVMVLPYFMLDFLCVLIRCTSTYESKLSLTFIVTDRLSSVEWDHVTLSKVDVEVQKIL